MFKPSLQVPPNIAVEPVNANEFAGHCAWEGETMNTQRTIKSHMESDCNEEKEKPFVISLKSDASRLCINSKELK